MSPMFPVRPGNLGAEPEPTSIQAPRQEREQARMRWEVRAAQWRALEIARSIWGEEVTARLSGLGAGVRTSAGAATRTGAAGAAAAGSTADAGVGPNPRRNRRAEERDDNAPAHASFRGLLHLEVPFDGGGSIDLERHRERESAFSHAAGLDPVLRRIPLVYVFGAS